MSFTDPGVKVYGCALPPGLSGGSEVLNRQKLFVDLHKNMCKHVWKKNFFDVFEQYFNMQFQFC